MYLYTDRVYNHKIDDYINSTKEILLMVKIKQLMIYWREEWQKHQFVIRKSFNGN